MNVDTQQLVTDFLKVADLSHMIVSRHDIRVEKLPAPHCRPKSLPTKSHAVYVFCTQTRCLKVGKVKSNSQARFTVQHYLPGSCQSNLAKSILSYQNYSDDKFLLQLTSKYDENSIGRWIEENTERYHFFLSDSHPDALLMLFEIFLQCRLNPLFEGKPNKYVGPGMSQLKTEGAAMNASRNPVGVSDAEKLISCGEPVWESE